MTKSPNMQAWTDAICVTCNDGLRSVVSEMATRGKRASTHGWNTYMMGFRVRVAVSVELTPQQETARQ